MGERIKKKVTAKDNYQLRKPRFLKRNKRRACLSAEQAASRLLQNHNNNSSSSKTVTPRSTTDVNNTNSTTNNNNTSSPTTNSNNNNNNKSTNDSLFNIFGALNKRPPERVGSMPGNTEKYVISDRDEVKLNASGRQVFVINKNLKFFKLASVRRAKRSHPTVTKRKYKNFQAFTKKWLKDYVNEQQQQQCIDWMLGKNIDKHKINATSNSNNYLYATKMIVQQDLARTPYRIFNRYKVFGSGHNQQNQLLHSSNTNSKDSIFINNNSNKNNQSGTITISSTTNSNTNNSNNNGLNEGTASSADVKSADNQQTNPISLSLTNASTATSNSKSKTFDSLTAAAAVAAVTNNLTTASEATVSVITANNNNTIGSNNNNSSNSTSGVSTLTSVAQSTQAKSSRAVESS